MSVSLLDVAVLQARREELTYGSCDERPVGDGAGEPASLVASSARWIRFVVPRHPSILYELQPRHRGCSLSSSAPFGTESVSSRTSRRHREAMPTSRAYPNLSRLRYLLLLSLLQLTPQDLARPTLWQLVYELDRARVLVGGHLALGPLDDVLRAHVALLFFPEDYHSLGRLAAALVGDADDSRFLDSRVLVERALDLRGPDVRARHVDHTRQPVDHETVALFVHHPDVAGLQETLAVAHKESPLVGTGSVPVAPHHLRTRRDDLALFPHADLFESLRVHHTRVHVERRHSEALQLGPVRRVHVRLGYGLRKTITLRIADAGKLLELLADGLWHRGPAATDELQRGEVVLSYLWVREQVHDHRRDVRPVGDAMAFH